MISTMNLVSLDVNRTSRTAVFVLYVQKIQSRHFVSGRMNGALGSFYPGQLLAQNFHSSRHLCTCLYRVVTHVYCTVLYTPLCVSFPLHTPWGTCRHANLSVKFFLYASEVYTVHRLAGDILYTRHMVSSQHRYHSEQT
jgi:hypothetical protein